MYSQIYNTTVAGNGGATALNYTSPVLHTVVLSDLKPGTTYFYQVGDGTTYSGTYNFTALAAPSESLHAALQNHSSLMLHLLRMLCRIAKTSKAAPLTAPVISCTGPVAQQTLELCMYVWTPICIC